MGAILWMILLSTSDPAAAGVKSAVSQYPAVAGDASLAMETCQVHAAILTEHSPGTAYYCKPIPAPEPTK